jgi:hypothetical protein
VPGRTRQRDRWFESALLQHRVMRTRDLKVDRGPVFGGGHVVLPLLRERWCHRAGCRISASLPVTVGLRRSPLS